MEEGKMEVNLKGGPMEEEAKEKQPGWEEKKEDKLELNVHSGVGEERGEMAEKVKESQSIIDWNQVTVFSEGNIRRHKIGEGVFVEGDQSKEIYYENAAGTVWLAEDQTLKMRNVNDELTK